MSASWDEVRQAPLVVCDFDGTLAWLTVPWDELRTRLRARVEEWGLAPSGGGLDSLLRAVREGSEERFAELCALVSEYEVAGFSPDRVRRPLVAALAARAGRPWAVFSSNTRRVLEHAMASAPFAACPPSLIVGKEDVRRGKPDPEGLSLIAGALSASRDDILFLGDSDFDRDAGRVFGVRTLILDSRERSP